MSRHGGCARTGTEQTGSGRLLLDVLGGSASTGGNNSGRHFCPFSLVFIDEQHDKEKMAAGDGE